MRRVPAVTADTCATCDHPWSRHYYNMRRYGCDGVAGGFCRCIAHPPEDVAPPAPTTESVDDYEGWAEVSFLPSVKYAAVWDEARDGWRVLTLDDGGAFA